LKNEMHLHLKKKTFPKAQIHTLRLHHLPICSLFKKEQGVVYNTVALAFTLKMYLKAKEEELWKLRYFMKQKIHLIFKKKNQKSFKTLL